MKKLQLSLHDPLKYIDLFNILEEKIQSLRL